MVVAFLIRFIVEIAMAVYRNIRWPVFFVEGHDVMVARDPTHFMKRFEVIDIREGAYELFDSIGQIIAVSWHGDNLSLHERYLLEVSLMPAQPDRLANILRRFLRDAKPAVSSNAPLNELVERTCESDRY
jgi:hypothetical protein